MSVRCCKRYEPKYRIKYDCGFGEIQELDVCEYHFNLDPNWQNHILEKVNLKN